MADQGANSTHITPNSTLGLWTPPFPYKLIFMVNECLFQICLTREINQQKLELIHHLPLLHPRRC